MINRNKGYIVTVFVIVSIVIVIYFIRDSANKKSVVSINLDAEKTLVVNINNQVNMEFILIESGSFQMGASEEIGDEDELPVRIISITQPFYMGKYEVTQRQWEAVMGNNPSKFVNANNPVESVSFLECIAFNEKLSKITGLMLSLPTEAMWEYACRAGTSTKWFYGDVENESSLYSWIGPHDMNKTHEVGTKIANPWGLYDMYGNVQEWCLDWYQNPYSAKELINPVGPMKGDSRVVRGGGWGAFADNARSSYRNAVGQEIVSDGIGFRCVIVN